LDQRRGKARKAATFRGTEKGGGKGGHRLVAETDDDLIFSIREGIPGFLQKTVKRSAIVTINLIVVFAGVLNDEKAPQRTMSRWGANE